MARDKGKIRLNNARVLHDRAAVDEYTQLLAQVDAEAGYTPRGNPEPPLQHGQRMRAGRSRRWWEEYADRAGNP